MIPILDAIMPVVGKLLDFIPDPQKKAEAKQKMLEELNRNQEAILTALTAVDQKQSEVNAEDAKSGDKFRSYWRPAVAWVCVAAFAWEYVIQPVTVFVLSLCKVQIPPMPVLGMGEMMPVLLGLLGLAGMRSVDKKNGTA